jgi:GNAT superfamily N-acetyltransferase
VVSPRVRPAGPSDAAAIAFLHWQGWRATYAGLIPEAVISRRSLARRLAEWTARLHEPGIALVVEDEAGVVRGFLHATAPRNLPPEPPPGPPIDLEVGYLYVDPKGQGRGLGRALLAAMAEAALAQGLRRGLVVAFAGNPFTGFYERTGARLVAEAAFELDGWHGRDLYYVWDDLAALRPPTASASAPSRAPAASTA